MEDHKGGFQPQSRQCKVGPLQTLPRRPQTPSQILVGGLQRTRQPTLLRALKLPRAHELIRALKLLRAFKLLPPFKRLQSLAQMEVEMAVER